MEPILIRHATQRGFKTRFDTALVSYLIEDGDKNLIRATVADKISNNEYYIRTRYLFGADGARSQVVKQLDIPLATEPGQGLAINVLVRADLSHLVKARKGNLHWVIQPDRECPGFAWMGIVRMVKPYHEWLFIFLPAAGYDYFKAPISNERYLERVKEFIGDDTPAEILNISKWSINEIVAEKYSEGNM